MATTNSTRATTTTTTTTTRVTVIRYMGRLLQSGACFDSAGCVNSTQLGECALATFPGLDGGPEADVWDWALEAADLYAPDANQ